jgi:enamine deaminase RidA (YjgF/YER057c/UK114 family)
MNVRNHNPKELYPQYPGYAHAVEVAGGARTLYISGLNGYEADGKTMPESFEAQSELIWKHMKTILASAGMEVNDIVFLRTYLARPEYMEENKKIRKKHLGDHEVGLTVVCATLLNPNGSSRSRRSRPRKPGPPCFSRFFATRDAKAPHRTSRRQRAKRSRKIPEMARKWKRIIYGPFGASALRCLFVMSSFRQLAHRTPILGVSSSS